MGLGEFIEKMEIKHFLYLIVISSTFLLIGFVGANLYIPGLGATGSTLEFLETFHRVFRYVGAFFFVFFLIGLGYMIEFA